MSHTLHKSQASPTRIFGATSTSVRYIIGVMTGTSIDGIDVAVVRLEGCGLTMSAALLHHQASSLGKVRVGLKQLACDQPMKASEIAEVSWKFADVLANAIQRAWEKARVHHVKSHTGETRTREPWPSTPDLISLHGQTVYHKPPHSWQLLQAAPIVQRCKAPVVCDLRSADLTAGGEGAPLTPLADMILYRSALSSALPANTHDKLKAKKRPRSQAPVAIVNLGGFCNITSLPGGTHSGHAWVKSITGQDVCLCNLMLNHIALKGFELPFDRGGKRAGRGKVIPPLLSKLTKLIGPPQGSLGRSIKPRKSMGIMPQQLLRLLDHSIESHGAADTAATACAAIAAQIAESVLPTNDPHTAPATLVLAGGGSLHQRLSIEIRLACITRANSIQLACPPPRIVHSDALGIPSQAREAACWAILGALAADGYSPALPQVTGSKEVPSRAGAWLFP